VQKDSLLHNVGWIEHGPASCDQIFVGRGHWRGPKASVSFSACVTPRAASIWKATTQPPSAAAGRAGCARYYLLLRSMSCSRLRQAS